MLAVARQLPQKRSTSGACWEYTRDPTFLAIVVTLVFIALLVFSLRVYVRVRIVRSWGADDWFAFAAALSAVAVLVVLPVATSEFRRHPDFFNNNTASTQLLFWIVSVVNILGLTFVKLSGAFFLLRLSKHHRVRRLLYITIVIVPVCAIAWLFGFILQCSPPANAWASYDSGFGSYRPWNCITPKSYVIWKYSINATNILSDVILTALSIIFICNLQVCLRARILVLFFPALGLLAFATALVRTVKDFNPLCFSPYDRGSCVILWTIIEFTAGMVAANLATLKPLLEHLRNRPDSFTRAQNDLPTFKPPPRRAASSSLRLFLYSHPSIDPNTPTQPPEAHSRTHTLSRYHDPASNVTFDIVETSPRYSRATTRRHTRTTSGMSNWTHFSQAQAKCAELEGSSPRERTSGTVSLREGVGARSRAASVGAVLVEFKSEGDALHQENMPLEIGSSGVGALRDASGEVKTKEATDGARA